MLKSTLKFQNLRVLIRVQNTEFLFTSIHRNVIHCKIGDWSVACLLDSGAAISCISQSFLAQCKVPIVDLGTTDISEVSGVGGERLIGK